jgi:NAD(P)-dependent dehydrogenase (short-subunit alcohol dehydrogenase family)
MRGRFRQWHAPQRRAFGQDQRMASHRTLRRVAGMRIVVTGAAGAFGAATSEQLEANGATVTGLDLRVLDSRPHDIACDVTDAAAVREAIDTAAARMGGIDVVVNNAGIGTASAVGDGCGDIERQVLDVNAIGTWNVTAAALPHLLAAPRGHLVNVASLLAVLSFPWVAAYAASKRMVCAISDTTRAEHAADGLTVTTIYPGYVATPIHDPAYERSGRSLAGIVPEDGIDQVVDAYLRAIVHRPRDIGTTRLGTVVLHVARAFPGLVDAVVQRRLRSHGLLDAPTAPTTTTAAAP